MTARDEFAYRERAVELAIEDRKARNPIARSVGEAGGKSDRELIRTAAAIEAYLRTGTPPAPERAS